VITFDDALLMTKVVDCEGSLAVMSSPAQAPVVAHHDHDPGHAELDRAGRPYRWNPVAHDYGSRRPVGPTGEPCGSARHSRACSLGRAVDIPPFASGVDPVIVAVLL
jgi:hypothetical protein